MPTDLPDVTSRTRLPGVGGDMEAIFLRPLEPCNVFWVQGEELIAGYVHPNHTSVSVLETKVYNSCNFI